jgi:uncharacterized repeat protein (TIGR03806 family)
MRNDQRIRTNYRRRFAPFCTLFMMPLIILSSCSQKSDNYPDIPQQGWHQHLSDYRIFTGDLKNLEPAEYFLPYDLNTELFSDYSQKLRFVYLPEGLTAEIGNDLQIDFPVGTLLVKNFFYNLDQNDPSKGRRILETRLLLHRHEGWVAATYAWDDAQQDATLLQAGGNKQVSWLDKSGLQRAVNYRIPTVNDCRSCHSRNNRMIPLGPRADNLNKVYDYATGPYAQLNRWVETGYLKTDLEPEELPSLPVWDRPASATLNLRARAYLDVNCSNCHNPAGTARNSALFLEYHQENLFHLGVCKVPVAAGTGSGGLKYNIFPGRPDESILLFRMESVKPRERMPEIGRTLLHEEAAALIREWIAALDLPACEE